MNKCDFCKDSEMDKNGNLRCPFITCFLSDSEWEKIINVIGNNKKQKSKRK